MLIGGEEEDDDLERGLDSPLAQCQATVEDTRLSPWSYMLILTVPLHDGADDDMPGFPYASQLPEAFKPEMLATLEKSCRKFFM
jgi:hypothetical protein